MKAAILAAARTVILEAEPEHFSLREVARRSGYSPADLYAYFSGKEDLVQAVANESLAQLYAALSYAARDLPSTERLIALGLAYVRFARQSAALYADLRPMPSQRTSLQTLPLSRSPYRIVVQIVQEGLDAAAFRVRPGFGVEEMAYGVWVMAHGMTMLQQTHLRSSRPISSPMIDECWKHLSTAWDTTNFFALGRTVFGFVHFEDRDRYQNNSRGESIK
jgi:AcrR family transcriptional regulator